MKTSADGRAFIEAFEGKFLHTYDDGTGVLTIGYGHTTAAGSPAVSRGQTITDAECDAILATDLGKVERTVEKLIDVAMTQAQFDALVSFEFNTGSLGKSSIRTKINGGQNDAAMDTLLEYDHAKGKQMDGLTRRRKAERVMFMGNVAAALRLADAHVSVNTEPMPQAPHRPGEAPPPAPSIPRRDPAPPPSITNPAKGSIGDFIASILAAIFSIFKRK